MQSIPNNTYVTFFCHTRTYVGKVTQSDNITVVLTNAFILPDANNGNFDDFAYIGDTFAINTASIESFANTNPSFVTELEKSIPTAAVTA